MIETFWKAYLICALWSSTDDDGENLDSLKYEISDFDPHTMFEMRKEVEQFLEKAKHVLFADDALDETAARKAGHDFWLTRNHHGAGFWDGDWPKHGDFLTKLAHSFGECELYVVSGKIYAQGFEESISKEIMDEQLAPWAQRGIKCPK